MIDFIVFLPWVAGILADVDPELADIFVCNHLAGMQMQSGAGGWGGRPGRRESSDSPTLHHEDRKQQEQVSTSVAR